MSESFASAPQQAVLPAYPYLEYSDDDNIQGFFSALNGLQQGYLDWFNQTPLAVYTASSISGLLLDWCATGIYGISRPVLSTQSVTNIGAWNSYAWNTPPWDGARVTTSGTVTVATDDIYKRVLTWHLYRGDGNVPSITWLRRRVARFIYGAGGTDISVDDLPNIGIVGQPLTAPSAPTLSSASGGTIAATTYYVKTTYLTADGETTPSTESSLAVAADYLLVVDSPASSVGATGYNVYVSTATGTETKQNSAPIAIGTNWTEPTTGLVSGSALPTSNTSLAAHSCIIAVPSGTNSNLFAQCVANGVLALPFQMTYTVTVA